MAHTAQTDTDACVQIVKITVLADRMRADVRCKPSCRFTTPALSAQLRQRRPQLARHTCINDKGSTFGAVMDRTPVPHLLEHLVVDLLVESSMRAGGADEDVFVGTSEWVDREKGLARIEVSYRDDLEALAAFKDAVNMLNGLLANITAS